MYSVPVPVQYSSVRVESRPTKLGIFAVCRFMHDAFAVTRRITWFMHTIPALNDEFALTRIEGQSCSSGTRFAASSG